MSMIWPTIRFAEWVGGEDVSEWMSTVPLKDSHSRGTVRCSERGL
jgi:hypothetical protein